MHGWSKFNRIANWIFNIAYLNLLWILFSIIGLGLFGIFPATAAMFAIVRKWMIIGERDFNIFTTFWTFYKKDFIKLNWFTLLFCVVGCFLYFNFTFIILNSNEFKFLVPGMILVSLAYIMTLLFFFPVFVHFKLSFFQYIKQAFLLAVISPLELVGVALAGVILFGLIMWIPGLIPLFTGSVMALVSIYLTKYSFFRLASKTG